MGTLTVRVPDDIEEDLDRYAEIENLDQSAAVRKLLAERLDDWCREHALKRLDVGEITFVRAAELADLDVREFARLAGDRNVTWVGDDGLEGDLG